ncbi:MAG: HAD domain-containing protein [Dehalococcoidia bacterium]|nr:HAD domain-containing protein [Dehalococcoidia bacterium]
MKVLFLDIDGVLNSIAWMKAGNSNADWPVGHLDPVAVARLNRLITLSGAKVVLSSTWRLGPEPEYGVAGTLRALRKVGFAHDFIGRTASLHRDPDGMPLYRGDEIQSWLTETAVLGEPLVEGICILDDDSDMAHLLPWLVKTDNEVGLTDAIVDAALVMLNRPGPSTV